MSGINILLIAHEMHPFIKNSLDAQFLTGLAAYLGKQKNIQLRIMAPCYGLINQRTGGLHEVIRLSGVNIGMGAEQYSLLVKVASLKKEKIQVYFIHNEELYDRKGTVVDKASGAFYEDNDTRALFYSKAIYSTVKRQDWKPDIVHAHGWFSAFATMYLKTTYKNSPLFKHTKSVFTLYPDQFEHVFDREALIKKAKRRDLHPHHFDPMAQADYAGIVRLAGHYADHVTHHFTPPTGTVQEALIEQTNSQYIEETLSAGETYVKLYEKLLASS